MSEDLVEKPFSEAAAKVEEAHQKASEDLKSKVASAKASALKKLGQ